MLLKKTKICAILIIYFFIESVVLPQVADPLKTDRIQYSDLSILSAESLNEIGFEKLKGKKYTEAEKYFLNAIIKNPAVKYYYNNLSVVYINQGRFDEAYNNLEIAIQLDPNYVKALSNMAITCFYRFRFIESYNYYLKARQIDREYTIKRFDREKAEKRIKELYEKNPGNKKLERILKHLRSYSED